MNNNYARMQKFLDMLKEFSISNPEKEITETFVYSNLVRFNIDDNNVFNTNVVQQNYYEGWKERYRNTKNIIVNDKLHGNFCWFFTGYDGNNAVKLYIPMDFEHIQEGANQLFDFISSTNMSHQSKIASRIRNDNVVVRVVNLEDAKKIVDFVSNNEYIQSGMLKVNPFTPNINGIGMTMDNNFSFNSELSKLISSFINWLKQENRLDLVTVEEFNKYIKFQIDYTHDPDLKDIYTLLSKTTSKDFKFSDFIEHAKNKLVNDYDDEKRITNPEHYLEKAILVTEKYYPGNSKEGILEYYLHHNATRFTRKENARGGLIKYVSPRDLMSIMTKKLHENGITFLSSESELIDKYVDIVLNKQKNNDAQNNINVQDNYIQQFEIIKAAYISTLNVYDMFQAEEAFRRLYLNNNPECFTNRYGDRTKLENLIASYDVKKIIISNINLEGIDINNVDDILHRFMDSLGQNTNIRVR